MPHDRSPRGKEPLDTPVSARWYREVLDALPAAVYTTDREGRITYCNDAAIALAGKRPKFGVDRWCVTWRLFHPDGRPMRHDECPMAVALKENREVWGAEAIAERPDGSRVPFLPFPTPLRDADGGLVGAVNMMVDISDRKAAELERQRLVAELKHLNETLEQRIEERSRALIGETEERRHVEAQLHQLQKTEAIGQLTGGVAHDFNNLLTAVMGNLECLMSRSLDHALRRHVEAALRAARRGANLTQQLLAFSRRQQLELKPGNINELVSGMGEMLLPALGGTIRVQLRLAHGLWPALIDANQVESAIVNLAINARDAMPEGGTVTIETANIHVGSACRVAGVAPGDYVMIAVADIGCGMIEAVRQRAFDPFFTTKDVGKGSGLGLSQVYGITRQSGGTAEIESSPGAGTTVRLYLPRARPDRSAAPQEMTRSLTGAAARSEAILLVDDDDDVRATIAAALSELGYRVEAVTSAGSAIALLETRSFDLVVMDFAMPGITGAEAGRIMATRWPNLPVLYITGYADPPLLKLQSAEGMMLRKPFLSGELDARIRALLDRPSPHATAAKVVTLRARPG